MKFAFKNPELEKWLYEGFHEASVQAQIERQLGNSCDAIILSADRNNEYFCKPHGLLKEVDVSIYFFKKRTLVKEREYTPDQWNPYPEVTPPSEGWYMVTLEGPECGEKVKVEVDWYHPSSDNWELNARQRVRAFRAFPKPYEEEKKSK